MSKADLSKVFTLGPPSPNRVKYATPSLSDLKHPITVFTSQCDCPCHTPKGKSSGMMHFMACCDSDPESFPESAWSVPCNCGAAAGDLCGHTLELKTKVRIWEQYVDSVHPNRYYAAKKLYEESPLNRLK
jgi:hypothetical protein